MIDRNEFYGKLSDAACKNGMSHLFNNTNAELFYKLTLRMLEVNEHMNLTAICDLDGIILKHYIDSLTVSKYIPEGSKILDIGCGAGFPTLPLAIVRPDLQITALDSTAKRIEYIRETVNLLGLANVTAITARAEETGHDLELRENFNIVIARAVARLNILAELSIPFVKIGGSFIAMKANAAEEEKEALKAIKTLGGELISSEKFELISENFDEDMPRCIINIKKVSETPKNYPRNNSQIKKKPL